MERDGLFVDDLLETLSRVRAAPAGESPDVTTQALGEEGDQVDDGVVTSDAVGEEGDQVDDVVFTSQALGEEGDQPDDQPFDSGWESSSAEHDLYLDVPVDSDADSDDDVDPLDAAL